MIVYLLTNKVNGKQYVGQTVQTFNKRWSSHGSDAKRNRGPHALVHALLKYGKESFDSIILHVCETREEMNFVEIFYIAALNTKAPNGYNIADGGNGTIGVPYTKVQLEKFRKTIGDSRKGAGNSFFGKHLSPEHKEKLRLTHLGRKQSAEHIAKRMKGREWRHGTSTGYGKYSCRCELCRKWKHDDHIRKYGVKTKEEISKKLSESHKGIPAWNRGTAKGVYWDKGSQRWAVKLWINGKTRTLGRFKNKEDAERFKEDYR